MQIDRPLQPRLLDQTQLAQGFGDEVVIVKGVAAFDGKRRVLGDRRGHHRQRLVRRFVLTGQKIVDQLLFDRRVVFAVFPAIAVQQPGAGGAADQALFLDRNEGFLEPGVFQKDGERVELDGLRKHLVAGAVGQVGVDLVIDFAMGAGGKAMDLAALDWPPQEVGLAQRGKVPGAVRIKDQLFWLAFKGDLVKHRPALIR